MMNFELLPNEILLECLKYLDAIDIFYSFDGLNSRFQSLICSIRLLVDMRHVDKFHFDHFCMKMLSNKKIQEQICSLKLSNGEMCQIHIFLSRFSLKEFSRLQSLTLVELRNHNTQQLQSMLHFYLN